MGIKRAQRVCVGTGWDERGDERPRMGMEGLMLNLLTECG